MQTSEFKTPRGQVLDFIPKGDFHKVKCIAQLRDTTISAKIANYFSLCLRDALEMPCLKNAHRVKGRL